MAQVSDADLTGFTPKLPYELGRYRLDAEIGRGGMGAVYHAEDTMLDRAVAVKILLPALAADHNFVQRFKREAQMAARLEHPNIVTVHDVGEQNHLVYFVMRFVTGRPLDRLIEEGLPWARAESIAVQVAEAMAYAHENKVIHRDIKPENVIVSKDGLVTITDFGLARPQAEASGPTQAGVVLGTPGYMAPEQATGEEVDHRADIYSFGVMLFELATGTLPFDGKTAFAIINQHINTPPPTVKDRQPQAPDWLSNLVARLLAKEPAKRPQTMAEVSDILKSKQGSSLESSAAGKTAKPTDATAQGLVAAVRRGDVSLADALRKHPEVARTLQEVFRREMTAVSFDLAGSTALKQSGGGTVAIGPLFNAYRLMVDEALKKHECVDAVWAGDGTVAMFDSPSEAVSAAQDIVRNLRQVNTQFADTPDLGVRVGIHTGSVLRDPNHSLGQVTSSTLDITGHIQKDAQTGLVEVSQATLDKLPSQQGWIRIRVARDANINIYAWHPDGPEHIPQSWIQRMFYGRPEDAQAERDREKARSGRTTLSEKDKARSTGSQKTGARAGKGAAKLTCPYCETEVTAQDQACPSCHRLNRHFDPSTVKTSWLDLILGPPRPKNAIRPRRQVARQAVQMQKRQLAKVAKKLPAAERLKQEKKAKEQAAANSQAMVELLMGVILSCIMLYGGAYVLATFAGGLWWEQSGGQTHTRYLALALLLAATAGAGNVARNSNPAIGIGIICGIPPGLMVLWYYTRYLAL